jgi:Outer membrane protein beta-barrel domain
LHLLYYALFVFVPAASAQIFVSGQGGFAALSNAAAATSVPVSASNYDSKVGAALNVEAGYHLNDWFSFQMGYIWNRNRIVSTEVGGGVFRQLEATSAQHAIAGDVLLYFRPRTSRIRPYLSAGPAWVRFLSGDDLAVNKPGLRVAVGADVKILADWWFRYTYGETMTANPFGQALHPPSSRQLMNFQNQFGVMKVF